MNESVGHLQDVFQFFGPIDIKRMFSGRGVFHQGLMFGIIAHDNVYLKADAENVSAFTDRGLPQFEYRRKGKVAKLSYWQAPEEIMDDCEEAAKWARRSFEAALRAKRPAHCAN